MAVGNVDVLILEKLFEKIEASHFSWKTVSSSRYDQCVIIHQQQEFMLDKVDAQQSPME